jgi:hypothetical protein
MSEKAPEHKMHHEHVKQHEVGDFKHHSKDFMKHAAGHQYEQEKVKAMCGGGMAGKK